MDSLCKKFYFLKNKNHIMATATMMSAPITRNKPPPIPIIEIAINPATNVIKSNINNVIIFISSPFH